MTIAAALLGGLGLFLYGMQVLTAALKRAAGHRLHTVLTGLTTNRCAAAGTGLGMTAVIQSSSVVSVLVVGFISAGLMRLPQGMGVILGAKLGATVNTQIIAFNITEMALFMVALGFLGRTVMRRESLRQAATVLLGLGLVFVGMHFMAEATYPLRDSAVFTAWLHVLHFRIVALVVGALFTVVVQSSAATVGIVIILANQGLMPLPAALALALGAHIGTGITAILAAIGKPRMAQQAAAFHIGYATLTSLLWLPLLGLLQSAAEALAPVGDHGRAIAHAMTLSCAVNLVIGLPLVPLFATLLQRIMPAAAAMPVDGVTPRYLDEQLLTSPSVALDAARRELIRMGQRLVTMIGYLPHIFTVQADEAALKVGVLERQIDALHKAIIDYLRRLGRQDLDAESVSRLSTLLYVANLLENISDQIDEDMMTLGRDRLERGLVASPDTVDEMNRLHAAVSDMADVAVAGLADPEHVDVCRLAAGKAEVKRVFARLVEHLKDRLTSADPKRLETYRLESEYAEYLRTLGYVLRRLGRATRGLGTDETADASSDMS